MEHASRRLAAVLSAVSAVLVGCGNNQGPSADVAADTGLDAASDTAEGAIIDAPVDVGTDVGVDVAADTEWDAAAEVSTDAEPDAAPDVLPDAVADIGIDEGADVPIDAGPDALADAGPDAVIDAGVPAAVAFRFSDIDLRDPHGFVSLVGCRDVTPEGAWGFSINDDFQTKLTSDGDSDGALDLSPTVVFRSFSQTAATQPVEFHYARCTTPATSTTCRPAMTSIISSATNMTTAQCLTFIPGTVRPYVPAITSTSAPCFVTDPRVMTVPLFGANVPLRDARIAARYVGSPAGTLTNGLFLGFLAQADADLIVIPSSYALVGGQRLSSVLPGGTSNCASFSDKDTHGGVPGWWFYFNFDASRITWSDT
jgi:hypothetical protein